MKSTLLRAFTFGVGFALVVGLLGSLFLWYSSRPAREEPWNADAFSASLSTIDAWEDAQGPWKDYQTKQMSKSGTLEFTYIVENKSGKDYSTDGASVIAMVRRPDGLASSEEAINVKYPIFIPTGQKVAVVIGIPYGGVLGRVDKNTDLRKAVREHLPKLTGFVLFDKSKRYQIELPKGW